MFTGIIEAIGTVREVSKQGSNLSFWIESPISHQLKPDQSVSHDGVCLTVEATDAGRHRVTAIEETLKKTNLGGWKPGTLVNLEQCLVMGGRLDGHIVQGHVDATIICQSADDRKGSWEYRFSFDRQFAPLLIEKGAATLNGISLTVFDITFDQFSVAIIPYTREHTNISKIGPGSIVNIEFDIIGKYLLRKAETDTELQKRY